MTANKFKVAFKNATRHRRDYSKKVKKLEDILKSYKHKIEQYKQQQTSLLKRFGRDF
jgi:hypothetical protein